MSKLDAIAVPAFTDNYLWLIANREPEQDGDAAYVVDPGDASVIEAALEKRSLKLKGILTTHHHFDHTGGIEALVNKYNVPVYGPDKDPIPARSRNLKGGENIRLSGLNVQCQVMFLPGHTQGHIAYLFETGFGQPTLFCGDTLFAGGCGRLLGGTPDQLYQSLETIKALDPETLIYCAHEYTVKNLQFASMVEPNNTAISERLSQSEQMRSQNQATIPTTLKIELETNPFLRCDHPDVVAAAREKMPDYVDDPESVFLILRKWKDKF